MLIFHRFLLALFAVFCLLQNTAKAQTTCTSLLSLKSNLKDHRRSAEKIKQESAVKLENLTVTQMRDILLDVAEERAQTDLFSEEGHEHLRRSLIVAQELPLIESLAAAPYQNEISKRKGKKPSELVPSTSMKRRGRPQQGLKAYGISPYSSETDLLEMTEMLLTITGSLAVTDAREKYIASALDDGYFLGLDFSAEESPIISETPWGQPVAALTSVRRLFSYSEASTYWMFSSLLREKLIRQLVNRKMSENKLPFWPQKSQWDSADGGTVTWPSRANRKDQLIMLVASVPELLPYLHLVPLMEFEPYIDFNHPDEYLNTPYKKMREEVNSPLIRFFLEREVVGQSSVGFEDRLVQAALEIVLPNPDDLVYQEIPEEKYHAIKDRLLVKWGDFLRSKGLSERDHRLTVSAQYEFIQVSLKHSKTEKESQKSLGLLMEFYLQIATEESFNSQGAEINGS